MGLANFFKSLFGSGQKTADNDITYSEPAVDAVKDASDFVMPQPEVISEKTAPVMERQSALTQDGNEGAEEIRTIHSEGRDRMEEAAD